jgi:hypothetical protein
MGSVPIDDNTQLGSPGPPVHAEIVLWQDVQPGADEGALIVLLSLASDREAVFGSLSVEEVRLEYASESWSESQVEETRVEPFEHQYTLRGGPEWPKGALVDVAVKLRTTTGVEVLRLENVQVLEAE